MLPVKLSCIRKIIKHEMRNHLIDLTMGRTAIESKSGFSPAALSLKYISTEETPDKVGA